MNSSSSAQNEVVDADTALGWKNNAIDHIHQGKQATEVLKQGGIAIGTGRTGEGATDAYEEAKQHHAPYSD